MDLHIEFKNASKYQAQELFKRFYNPNDSLDDVAEVVGLGDGELEDKLEEDDSGYTSSAMETSEDSSKAVVSGSMHHKRARRLTALRMNELAERFSAAIPERQISMASLQGYLMTYKIRAADAAKNVEAWVQKELKDKLEMESKKRDRDRRRAEKKAEREKSKAERASSDRGNESDGDGDFKANSRRRKRKTKKNDSERSGMEEDRKRAKGSKTPRDAAAEYTDSA
ncbi:hypothetical protein MPER_02302 [Moniliophthora perniciosa FA553]|nr:hypothetical protein MPER_02302 [Moniliophthora perniciosa FA553]